MNEKKGDSQNIMKQAREFLAYPFTLPSWTGSKSLKSERGVTLLGKVMHATTIMIMVNMAVLRLTKTSVPHLYKPQSSIKDNLADGLTC